MPREESWHKGLHKVRYVKLQANSSVITWVGWAWHVCSSRKEEAKQLGKGLEPGLGAAEESFKGLNNNCLRKAEVKDMRDISDIPVRPQKPFQKRFSQGEKKKITFLIMNPIPRCGSWGEECVPCSALVQGDIFPGRLSLVLRGSQSPSEHF